jgi:2-polyprenyl-6-methoxyphenol hydroxylase-like FAD-dependent oxidoreductase
MRVIIVGAGIGGLVTAVRLQRRGIDCTVHEQSEPIREAGVGINLLPYAVRELAELGLLDRLDACGIRTQELCYAHRLGPQIMRRRCGLSAGFAVPQFSVHRGKLHGVLLRTVRERLGDAAVRAGHRLVGFEQDARGVHARFVDRCGEDVAVSHGDVLVGADGIHSTVRSTLFPNEGPPRWNGVMMWRGATEWPQFGGGSSVLIAGGTDAKLVVYPIAPGSNPQTRLTNWAICVRTGRAGDPPPSRQEWARAADRTDLQRHVEHFRTSLLDHAALVMATPESFEFPMCDRDPLPHWTRGRVTLLGDAAHPMYPMGSNGAGQAIVDAAALAEELAVRDDPAEALRAYERERLPATSRIVVNNRRGGPERVIDEVERRAPAGFDRLEDVIEPAVLDAIVSGYYRA